MAHTQLHSYTQSGPQYIVHLDSTHIAEVRKQGQQLGIYTVTASGKKRGILLPIETWHAIEKYRHLINVAVDLSLGSLTTDKVAETIFQQQRNIHQVQGIKYLYPNNGCNQSRYPNSYSRTELSNSSQNVVQSNTPSHGVRQHSSCSISTTKPIQGTNGQHCLDKQDEFETVPLMEYYGFQQQGSDFPESTIQEAETGGNVDTFSTTYVC